MADGMNGDGSRLPYDGLTLPVYTYKINWRNTLTLTCGNRMCVAHPGVAGDTKLPDMRQNSPRFVVWKCLHLKELQM